MHITSSSVLMIIINYILIVIDRFPAWLPKNRINRVLYAIYITLISRIILVESH